MRKNSNIIQFEKWPNHHRTGLEGALQAKRRHNKRRMRFKWGADMLRGVLASWGRWLYWASRQQWYDGNVPIDLLLTSERVEAYVAYLISCGDAPATIRHRVMGLERMLAALAPDHDRGWLNEIKFRFKKTGDRAKKRARIQFTDDLIRFAAALAEAAGVLAQEKQLEGLLVLRVALQIMFLAYRPMRLKNFHLLQIGQNVKCTDGPWRLEIEASATKRGNVYDPVLPARLVELLERYLSLRRKVFGVEDCEGPLWLSKDGKHQSARSINYHICAQTKKEFGRSICPHLFRDAVVTSVATYMPENVRMSMPLVGNRDPACTDEHYNQAQRVIADRRYNTALDDFEDGV